MNLEEAALRLIARNRGQMLVLEARAGKRGQ
jgi:hypothetical protein